jgi:hypothetical protein
MNIHVVRYGIAHELDATDCWEACSEGRSWEVYSGGRAHLLGQLSMNCSIDSTSTRRVPRTLPGLRSVLDLISP